MTGYFASLGARISEMADAPRALPTPEHLSLPQASSEPHAGEPAPQATSTADTPDALSAPEPPNSIILETTQAAAPPDASPAPVDAQSNAPTSPLLQPDPLRLAQPDLGEPTARPADDTTSAPEPRIPESDTTSPATEMQPASLETPPDESVSPTEFPEERTGSPEDTAQSSEDHLALFEAYLDQLNGRAEPNDTQPREQVAPQEVDPPPTVKPVLPDYAAQDVRAASLEDKTPQQGLEIGEIHVSVAAPPLPAQVPQTAPRRAAPPARGPRRFGHGLSAL